MVHAAALLPLGHGSGAEPLLLHARHRHPILGPTLAVARFLGIDLPPPLAAKNVVDTYWKTPVDDPYRFLENTRDPAVQTWMKAQADTSTCAAMHRTTSSRSSTATPSMAPM
ncbi:MAG: hypothetical protein IPF94_03840 [Betaproteobacteria bacterium]|nr:hypothetical protein [Betaproteobacteria bacterium]